MQERGIALGWKGITAGNHPTFSWKEFFDTAYAAKLLTAEEYQKLATRYAQVWCLDLHD